VSRQHNVLQAKEPGATYLSLQKLVSARPDLFLDPGDEVSRPPWGIQPQRGWLA